MCRVAAVKSIPAHLVYVVIHRLAGYASTYISFSRPNCIWLEPCGTCLCSLTLWGVLCYVFNLNSPVGLGCVLFGWLSAVYVVFPAWTLPSHLSRSIVEIRTMHVSPKMTSIHFFVVHVVHVVFADSRVSSQSESCSLCVQALIDTYLYYVTNNYSVSAVYYSLGF